MPAARNGGRIAVRAAGDERPVTTVVGDIVHGVNALARAEARLAVAELADKASTRARTAGRGAGIAAGGGILAILAVAGLLAAAAAALTLVMAAWLAILLVATVAAVGGALALTTGARQVRRALTPGPMSDDPKEHA